MEFSEFVGYEAVTPTEPLVQGEFHVYQLKEVC